MKRLWILLVITAALAILSTLGIFHFLRAPHGPTVVGVWKATDEFRHEHFFEFRDDGTLTWWDRDRDHDGTFTTRGPFSGTYRRLEGNTVVAETGGFPSQPLGILTLISTNELKQNGGHTLRQGLIYRRVIAE